MDSQVIRYKISAPAHDFALFIEEHGAYNLGAENVIFRPNKQLGDQPYYVTTNGRAFFAADKELLVLKDAGLYVIVRLSDGQAFHMEPPHPWLFGRVWVEDGHVHADLYKFDDPDAADLMKPIPLAEVSERLSEGWGTAADGSFPTANPNFVNSYRRFHQH